MSLQFYQELKYPVAHDPNASPQSSTHVDVCAFTYPNGSPIDVRQKQRHELYPPLRTISASWR